MKSSRLLLIIACFGIICVLFSNVVSTSAQDETGVTARVIPAWSNETPTPGSTVTVQIFLINDYSEPLTIDHIGLHVDWMEEDSFYGYDLSNDPVTVQSSQNNGTHAFDAIDVTIPQDASIGYHQYFVGVEGILANYTAFTWDSEPRILQIQSSGEDGTDGNNGGDGGTTSDTHQDQMLIIVGVVAVAVVALLIIFIIYKRKK